MSDPAAEKTQHPLPENAPDLQRSADPAENGAADCETDASDCETDASDCETDTSDCETDTSDCETDASDCETDADDCETDASDSETDADDCETDADDCETDASDSEMAVETAASEEALLEGPPEPAHLALEGEGHVEVIDDLRPVLEAVIFAATKPVALQQLRKLTGAPAQQLKDAIAALQEKFNGGVELAEVAEGYQFRTHPSQANWVRQLIVGKPQRLTRAMLETLAIVAYRQPITRPEIDEIRGVDCGGTLRVLLERNLVRILGKKEELGRPLLYGTTKYFLEFFQLKELKGLPTLREFAELSEEHRQQVDQRFAGDAPEEAAQDAAADGTAETTPPTPEPLEGPPERAAMGAAAARRSDEARPPETSELGEAAKDRAREDEELLAVLDKALARADSVLKKPEQEDEPQASGDADGDDANEVPAPPTSGPLANSATPESTTRATPQPTSGEAG